LNGLKDCDNLEVIIERRGQREDEKLRNHLNRLTQVGTYYVEAKRIKDYGFNSKFMAKSSNINGLQLADLIAYPMARKVLELKIVNRSFERFEANIYSKGGRKYGLKIFP